jgi:hypothetical protein
LRSWAIFGFHFQIGQLITLQKATVGLAKGTRGQKLTRISGAVIATAPENSLPTLKDAGIDENLAKFARKLAKLSDAEFDEARARSEFRKRRCPHNLWGDRSPASFRFRGCQAW